MPKTPPPRKTCRACTICIEQPRIQPRHLVHPIGREPMLFDVYGRAACPDCGTVWKRWHNTYSVIG